MNETKKEIRNCGECEFAKEQYNLFGVTNFYAVTCTKLNCGTKRFEINYRCPLKEENQ